MQVPEKYYDEIFEYSGQWDVPSKCGLRLLQRGDTTVIIVTELYQDNPGASVTAAGETLFRQICQRKALSPADVVYIECNPDTNSKLSFYDEEFFEVRFAERPVYRQLSIEEVKALLSDTK